MSRDYDPEAGKWYEDLDAEEVFKVLSVDPDEGLVRIQWLDSEVEEIDLDAWNELDLERAQEPEGWVDETDGVAKDNLEDDEEDEEDWDEDEDEDEDYDDDDDEYRDRE